MFFWAKPADSPEWEEIPATGGLLVAGTYNIAVQSPQPHFTIVSHLRQYRRQEDSTETLHWQIEHSSRTNGEGVGWIVQDLELTAGRWQISCCDADLVAELFGENADNSVTFQVIDLKGARLSSGPYDSSAVSLPALASSATSSVAAAETTRMEQQPEAMDPHYNHPPVTVAHSSHEASQPSPAWLHGSYLNKNDCGVAGTSSADSDRIMDRVPDRSETDRIGSADEGDRDLLRQSTGASSQPSAHSSTQSPNPQSPNSDDAVTEIFSPPTPPEKEFALNRSEFTAFPGETINISGHARRSGQLTITALTKNSAPIQENQRLTIPSSDPFVRFSVHLQIPSTWSEDAIVGLAELHPDDGSASLAQDFTVSAEPRYPTASSPRAEHSSADSWQAGSSQVVPSPEAVLPTEHPQTDVQQVEVAQTEVAQTEVSQLEASQAGIPPVTAEDADRTLELPTNVESLPNAQLTKTDLRPAAAQAPWNPELTDEDIRSPDIAFASSRSPDRTLHRLMALVRSSVAATAARTRFQQAQLAPPSLDDGLVDGIVGDVKVVSATDGPLGTVLPSGASRLVWESPETPSRLDPDKHYPDQLDDVGQSEPIEPADFNTSNTVTPGPSATLAPHDGLAIGDDNFPAVEPDMSLLADSSTAAATTTRHMSAIADEAAGDRSLPASAVDDPASHPSAKSPIPIDTGSEPASDPSVESDPLTDSRSATDSSSPDDTKSSTLSIDIPQSLRSGDLVSVVMKSKANPHPACVKLWVINSANQTVVDGPRWILDFSVDGDIRTGITHLTVPSRVQSLQFQACAYPRVPSDIEEHSDRVSPVATVTVHRLVAPRSTPYR